MPESSQDMISGRIENSFDYVPDYLAGWDDDDDISGQPGPGPDNDMSKKRKADAEILGVDTELDLTRKARVPRVKLDEARLLSENGIPKLRRNAPQVRLKGKGHEFSDAARLLSFYRTWLDDLYPKANFLDALAMVERAGHSKSMAKARVDWINEGKSRLCDETRHIELGKQCITSSHEAGEQSVSVFGRATPSRHETATDEDLCGRNIRKATAQPQSKSNSGGIAADDDLIAFVAVEDARSNAQKTTAKGTFPPLRSAFRGDLVEELAHTCDSADNEDMDILLANGDVPLEARKSMFRNLLGDLSQKAVGAIEAVEDIPDDQDALLAEAEAHASTPKVGERFVTTEDDSDYLDTFMEAEAQTLVPMSLTAASGGKQREEATRGDNPANEDVSDDLDALMAEIEAQS